MDVDTVCLTLQWYVPRPCDSFGGSLSRCAPDQQTHWVPRLSCDPIISPRPVPNRASAHFLLWINPRRAVGRIIGGKFLGLTRLPMVLPSPADPLAERSLLTANTKYTDCPLVGPLSWRLMSCSATTCNSTRPVLPFPAARLCTSNISSLDLCFERSEQRCVASLALAGPRSVYRFLLWEVRR